MIPSIGISVTDLCNLRCVYCPPFGESLVRCVQLCDLESIGYMLDAARRAGVRVVRLTGGEPLIEPERTRHILEHAVDLRFEKVILNTNGVVLISHLDWLEPMRAALLLKISLDTLNPATFAKVTRRNGDMLFGVLAGIDGALAQGFEIEINTVVNRFNLDEIAALLDFVESRNCNVKFFDVFSFGGHVPDVESAAPIEAAVVELSRRYQRITPERLPGERGIAMMRFITHRGAQALVVSHRGKYSSSKFYCSECLDCGLYPCDTGRFQMPLRADGLLSGCRMYTANGISIVGMNKSQVERAFHAVLTQMSDCFER